MHREDFEFLKQNIIYFDNGATSLKPKILSEATADYYNNYSANAHRGDYDISIKVDTLFEETRHLVGRLINAKADEIAFTNNTTDAINKLVFGYFKNILNSGDEVLLTKSEHASNVLPWFYLAKEKNIIIKYINLDSNHHLDMNDLKNKITNKTKVISIAHVTNVIGDIRPIKKISQIAHENDILVLVDGAQSVAHMPVDVKDLDIDFLTFSAHKMCGPTGVGILYSKEKYLKDIKPIIYGGGMNASFTYDGDIELVDFPNILDAGTPNIAGVLGFNKVLKYLMDIGMENIHDYEINLRNYAILKLKEVPNIIIYNEDSDTGIITFNIDGIFAQDLAIYLNNYNICVRAGNHCAKILKDEIGIKNTCRMSLYFYNTEKEIDELVYVLSNPNIKNELI